MSYRVRPYGTKPPATAIRTNWENIVLELLVGIISFGMGITGLKGGVVIMFAPLFLVSVISFAMAIHAIVKIIMDKRDRIRALEREIAELNRNDINL